MLGSSGDQNDDLALLRNIYNTLRPKGYLVLSVMNAAAVLPLPPGQAPSSVPDFVAALEGLPPSATMADTGNIFDRSRLLYFDGAFYRKEQFEGSAGRLPTELVVRDKRYTRAELADLAEKADLNVISVRPVQLGRWDDDGHDYEDAKELLLVAVRP